MKSGVAAPLVPRESQAVAGDHNRRSRPEMRGDDATVYPAVDFIRAPSGSWFDAVTGRATETFPEGSTPDPADADHRIVYQSSDTADDVVVAEYRRSPCGAAEAQVAEAGVSAVLSQEILDEINAARTDPAGYAARLAGSNNPEVLEAVAFLKRQSPLAPLKLKVALLSSATRHAADQGRTAIGSHTGVDGATVRDRVLAAGADPSEVGEEIAFGADSGPGVARQLIVDFGVPDRGHRAGLFKASLTYAGVACNPHDTYRLVCVIDVSGPNGR